MPRATLEKTAPDNVGIVAVDTATKPLEAVNSVVMTGFTESLVKNHVPRTAWYVTRPTENV